MANNKNRERLYSNLVRGIYALDGIDGEFVANLCRRIPFQPRQADWAASGILTEFPAAVIRAAEAECDAWKDEAEEVRESAQQDWDDDEWVSLHATRMAEVQGELSRAECKLTAFLAA